VAQETGGDPWAFDAMAEGELERCATQSFETHGRLDGIANCIGSVLLKPAHLTSDADWDDTLRRNLGTAFSTVRTAARLMRGAGSVVLFSSAAARIGLPNHEAIAAAKAGVIGLALSAAASYAPRGVRVNVVAPGLVDTPLAASITASELARKASEKMHPLGRLGTAEDVARALAWLLEPDASWVTGQVIGVDGGLATVAARG
jgi:NAD(P)-dependent dehydrogenase (short-subunit alcohol dehydrogenase family)